jgi:hypothetical protein
MHQEDSGPQITLTLLRDLRRPNLLKVCRVRWRVLQEGKSIHTTHALSPKG